MHDIKEYDASVLWPHPSLPAERDRGEQSASCCGLFIRAESSHLSHYETWRTTESVRTFRKRYSSVYSAENWTTIPWSSRGVSQRAACATPVPSTELRAVTTCWNAYLCGCELVCPVVPRPPLCLCRSDPLYRFPTDLNPPQPIQKKRVPHKGNNKPDLRENRILQWHFAWKKMTRQSNGSCLQRWINTRWVAEHKLIDTPFQFA